MLDAYSKPSRHGLTGCGGVIDVFYGCADTTRFVDTKKQFPAYKARNSQNTYN